MGLNRKIDLSTDHRRLVFKLINQHLPDNEVWGYGSRVTWTSCPQSDLDLVVFSDREEVGRVWDLREAFEESNLPFAVDVHIWNDLPESFRKEIECQHVVLQAAPLRRTFSADWPEFAIEDIAEVAGGGTPSTGDPNNFGDQIPWVTPRDLSGPHDRFISRGARGLSPEGLARCSARLLPAGSVLLSTRAPIGYVAIAKNAITTNQGFQSLIPTQKMNPEYLYYWLIANISKLEAYATGSTFSELSAKTLKTIKINVPPLPVQNAIVHMLGKLDDKIELNRRMNATIDRLLSVVFREWFVPMYRSIEADVPKGWTASNIASRYQLTMGQSPPSHTYNDRGEGWPFLQGSADFAFRFPEPRKYCISPRRLVQDGTTLLSIRAPVGRLNMAMTETCIGRGVAGVAHKSGAALFTYYRFKALQPTLRQYDESGTVFGAITKQQLESIPILEPPQEHIDAFESMATALGTMIRHATVESSVLTTVREQLLPRLISQSHR